MSIAPRGEMVNYLNSDGRAELTAEDLMAESRVVESELIQVNVNFIGDFHVVVEEIGNSPGTTLSMYIPKGILFDLLCSEPERPWNLIRTSALEKSLRVNVGWQKLTKRGMHTLKKPQHELCYIDPGISSGKELEELKDIQGFHRKCWLAEIDKERHAPFEEATTRVMLY